MKQTYWSSSAAETLHWKFWDFLGSMTSGPDEYCLAVEQELQHLAERPGNPLFDVMQSFAWEFQDAFQFWDYRRPRRTLKDVIAEMAVFTECALPALQALLLPKNVIPDALDLIRVIVEKETQRRAHPVLRDVLRAIHVAKDRALQAATMGAKALEMIKSIPDGENYGKPIRLLAQLGLAVDASSKSSAVLGSLEAVGVALLDEAGADSLFPKVIYCVLMCSVPCLWTELELLRLMLGDRQFCNGALGYAMTTLESALLYICREMSDFTIQDDPDADQDYDSDSSFVLIVNPV